MTVVPQARPSLALSALLRGWLEPPPGQDRQLTGLTLDSRETTPGSLFCALRGTRTHGLELASRAAAQGAAAVLAEPDPQWPAARLADLGTALGIPVLTLPGLAQSLSAIAGRFYGDPGCHLDIIAVTGTNGKTSVCQFTARALDGAPRCGVVGTLGYGFPGELTATDHTTPDAVRLQAILAELRGRGAGAVAVEISSHALDQGRAAGVPVATAVLTNLTRDHLDYHRDMMDYARAKQRLFRLSGLRHAVLNADDPFGREILEALDPAVQPVLYSLAPSFAPPRPELPWLRAEALESLPRGMRMHIVGSWGQGELSAPVLGRFNAANLLAVLGVLLLRGLPLDTALERLTRVQGVPGRMECFGHGRQPLVVVDYAHTPDALEQVLGVLREHGPRRLICLFGCGGERDRGKRPEMGEMAERHSDLVVITDDNPRGEDGGQIVAEILSGMRSPRRAQVQRNRTRAIRYAVCVAGTGDIVLVAGKGHETIQKIGAMELPFSDRAEVTQALNEWGEGPRECQ
jgi:UDP-N-acetylmuramoyl-L-alanyl-D-glutamate--2,6-diaminopimelate ligase